VKKPFAFICALGFLVEAAILHAQPANDSFTNAWALTGTFAITNGNSSQPSNATKEPGEPNHSGFTGGRSVWFDWTAPVSGLTRISTAGSAFNTLLAVYTGSVVNALTQVAANDNFTGQGNTSRVEFDAVQGTTYHIAIDGRGFGTGGTSSGNYVLTLRMLGSVVISSPTNGSLIAAGAPILVAVAASTPNPPIARVDFYRGTNLFESISGEPFSAILYDAPLGTNRLLVVMTDSANQVTTSAVVNVLVLNPGVTILSPADGATFLNTNAIVVSAVGFLPEGVMTNVEFYADGQKFAESTATPFTATLSAVTPGVHRLVGIGTDDTGLPHASAPVFIAVAHTLVATGSVWKFLDNGSNQGTNWSAPGFDDGGWTNGPAQLGYGDGDEATVVSYGADPNNKFTTTYFRHAFETTNVAGYTNLVLRVLRDDGALAYFNGVEAARFNMPTSAITYTTFAAMTASDDGTAFFPSNVSPALLVEGTNLLAVEIHQSDLTSSDISFELELLGVPAIPRNQPPLVNFLTPTNGEFFLAPANMVLEASASDADGSVAKVEFFADGTKLGEATNSPYTFAWNNPAVGAHRLGAVATDNEGASAASASIAITVYDALGTPLVRMTTPADGAVIQGPTNLLIAASATAPTGITNVHFLANGSVIGEDGAGPFSIVWSNAPFGTNLLAAVAFDALGASSTSVVASIVILPPPDNTNAPVVFSANPPPDATISNLTSIQVTFSECVSGVDATDLLVNGVPATGASGNGSNYAFTVARPAYGLVLVTWAMNHGITDVDLAPLPFDAVGTGATWSYNLIDLTLPSVAARNPPANAIVTNLTQVTVTFSEPVSGVDASDFLVNGTAADSLSSGTNTTYTFSFAQPHYGPVAISWATNHGIADLAVTPNAFNAAGASATWSYTLDTRTALVQSNALWLFIKGTSEASSPTNAWRELAFDDASWSNAAAPFFYGDPYATPGNPGTVLSDMQSNYTSIYLRKRFIVPNIAAVTNLFLRAQSDDGFIAWINGVEVYRYNLPPGEIPFNGVTPTSITEPNGNGAPYLDYVLADPATYLAEGPNMLAVHAFNQSLTQSSDFGFNAQLYTYLADASLTPPRVLSATPPEGEVFYLTNLTITFTESVSGVDASDLLVNGVPVGEVSGRTNGTYTFAFAQPPFGPVVITWAAEHGIADLDTTPKPFDGNSPSSTLRYTLLNPSRPTVATQLPPAGILVTNLTQITMTFSEEVTGLDAPDLLVNSAPATTLISDGTNYTFTFPQPAYGVVSIGWATNHGIQDLELPPTEFDPARPGNTWTYTHVDPVPVVVLLNPTNDAVFPTPVNITLQAIAADNDGVIVRVEFFEGINKLAEDTNAPFTFTWRNVPPGAYSLFAIATDNSGLMATSAPVNITVSQAATALVLSGAIWKYLDNGTEQSNAWREVTFDDSTWAAGPSELGYGDTSDGRPETTMVSFGPDPNNKYVTTYFRHAFVVTNVAEFTNLSLRVLRDDGAVVYLNGVEAARYNMPFGEINYLTLAASNVLGAAEALFFPMPLNPGSLVNGTNVLAVEVHQFAINSGSADISFDLELIANLSPVAPTVTLTSPTNGGIFLGPANITLRANATDIDGFVTRVEFLEGSNQLGEVTNAPFTLAWTNVPLGVYTLFAVATDNNGLTATSAPVSITVTDDLPVVLVRGPYLQIGTPTGGLVRWRTDLPSDAVVFYGTDLSGLTNLAVQATITNEHIVQISGLQPETKYYYSIGSSTRPLAGGPDYWFITSPQPAVSKATRLWVLGDSGTANQNARNVRNAYYDFAATNRPADIWLMLGDNAYQSGTDAEHQAAVFDMYPATLRNLFLWPTIGNHETAQSFTAMDFPYLDIFSLPQNGEAGGVPSGTEKYYSFDYANIHFICLDSMTSTRSATSPMAQWLQNDLAATAQDWIIVFFHHPPYTKGNHNSDAELELIEIRQNLLPILEANGVDLVLCGHSHAWERSFLLHGHYGLSGTLTNSMKIDGGDGREDGTGSYRKNAEGEGVVYTVAGNGGQITGGSLDHRAHFLSLNELGSMIIDVNSNRLDAIFLATNGVSRDHFTLLKASPDVTPPAAPANLVVSAGDDVEAYRSQIVLRWRDWATNEAGFRIERSADGDIFTPVSTVGANVTHLIDRGLDSATMYSYRVRSFNAAGNSAPSNLAAEQTHPQSDIVFMGSSVSFHAGVEGQPPIRYQWSFEGLPVFGATNETLTIDGVLPWDEGYYSVVITDANERMVSNPAYLFVISSPLIVTHPESRTNNVGSTAAFAVEALGDEPLSYQWRRNGVPISAAVAEVLTITDLQLTDQAAYDVVVENDYGAVTSHVALLVVNLAPFAGPDTIYRLPGEGVAVEIADLLLNDNDADGDPIALTGVSPMSAQGAQISIVGRYVRYLPGSGPDGTDTFTYTVADTRGGTELGVVTVMISDNKPPALAPIPDFIVNVHQRLAFTNAATDANVPTDQLTYSLEAGAPSNAHINPTTGLFHWRPGREHGPSTNFVTVLVSDNGRPSLSDRKSFTVCVNDYVEVSVGSAIVRQGESASVLVDIFSSANLATLTAYLRFTDYRLSDMSVEALAPELASVSLALTNAGAAVLAITPVPGRTLQGTQQLARLHFTAAPGHLSAFIPLQISSVNCTRVGAGLTPSALANDGRVAIISEQPLLEARWSSGSGRQLILYGKPGQAYTIESAANAADTGAWQVWQQVTLTNSFGLLVPETNAAPAIFYRARQ